MKIFALSLWAVLSISVSLAATEEESSYRLPLHRLGNLSLYKHPQEIGKLVVYSAPPSTHIATFEVQRNLFYTSTIVFHTKDTESHRQLKSDILALWSDWVDSKGQSD